MFKNKESGGIDRLINRVPDYILEGVRQVLNREKKDLKQGIINPFDKNDILSINDLFPEDEGGLGSPIRKNLGPDGPFSAGGALFEPENSKITPEIVVGTILKKP